MGEYGRLAGRIGRCPWKAPKPGQGAHQRDLSTPAMQHAIQRGVNRVQDPIQINREYLPRGVFVFPTGAGAARNSRIRDDEVEWVGAVHPFDPVTHICFVGDLDHLDCHFGAGINAVRIDRLEPFQISSAERERHPRPGIVPRQGGADAARRAGDEDGEGLARCHDAMNCAKSRPTAQPARRGLVGTGGVGHEPVRGHHWESDFMTLASMTGYARAEGHDDRLAWVWEIRSVNGKGLDLRVRTPSGWERFDPIIRAAVPKVLNRGNVSITLEVREAAGSAGMRVNRDFLDELANVCREYGEEPRYDRLLSVRGAVEAAGDDATDDLLSDDARVAAVRASLDAALDGMVVARGEEGARIETFLTGHLERIETLIAAAEREAALAPERLKARFREQVAALLEESRDLPEERLVQEGAILAAKADAREELDRLAAHVAAARALIATDGALGRKLDFLCQEFNREANTLCSKANDLAVTKIGLELKSAIEQFREQVQNVE